MAGLTTAAGIWATAAIGVAVGVGRYLLTVAGMLLTVGALSGLPALRDLLRHWAGSQERFVLSTTAGFSPERVFEVARHERVAIRTLERRATGTGAHVLVARLPPRYRPERLVGVLAGLEGVQGVDWRPVVGP